MSRIRETNSLVSSRVKGYSKRLCVSQASPEAPRHAGTEDIGSSSQWLRKLMLAAVWVERDSSAPAGTHVETGRLGKRGVEK